MSYDKSDLSISKLIVICAIVFSLGGCSTNGPEYVNHEASSESPLPLKMGQRVASITGLQGPEAVRYDDETDSYYVANFVGSGRDKDSNGFVIRVDAETGAITNPFITGSAEFPLHAPRGMYITADTLWIADADGVHGFSKTTGSQITFVDMTALEPGFLNDVASDGNGTMYVTDTGGERIYRMSGGDHAVAADDIGNPNGITYARNAHHFLIAPWDSGDVIRAWWPDLDSTSVFAVPLGSSIDGIELHKGRLIYAQQSDSTIQIYSEEEIVAAIKTPGKPADIGIDTKRNRVAVPYIALDRVDIWELPN